MNTDYPHFTEMVRHPLAPPKCCLYVHN